MGLIELTVKNFILVESIELQFAEGLNIITGETGAGKSLLVGAINLLTGGKVDWDVVSGTEKSEIIGVFEITTRAREILEDMGIESDEEIIIRRVLNPNQRKSRSYVNMTPVTQQFLRALTSALVDIHGQHEHQSLFDVSTHLHYLDKFAGNEELRERLKKAYHELMELKRRYQAELKEVEETEKVRDFLEFQLKELEDAELRLGEEEELEERIKVLSNLETLRSGISEAMKFLYEDDDSAYSKLTHATGILQDLSRVDQEFKKDVESLEEILIRVEDIWRRLLDYFKKLESEPEELDRLMARLSKINRLKEKYKTDIKGLLKILDETKKKLSKVEIRDEFLKKLKSKLNEKEREVKKIALELSKSRKNAAGKFEKLVMEELTALGMSRAVFVVDFKEKEIDETGMDEVEFLITTNPGESPRPIRKIASGGELSRVMLALKTVLSDIDDIPTLIFDEIDVGIGGRIAEVVGKKLKAISTKRQVIAITHLPQIAVYGDRHFVVEKESIGDKTVTNVREVKGDERVREIARMLAGETITESSINHALELLKSAGTV